MPDDEIHLTVPADADLAAVAIAAVAAVARAAGMAPDAVASARRSMEARFGEALGSGTAAVITVTARAERHGYWFEVTRGSWTGAAHEVFGR